MGTRVRPAAQSHKSTQCDLILAHLRRGRVLWAGNALRLFSVRSLSRRVCDLRQSGFTIYSSVITTSGGRRIAQHYLAEPCSARDGRKAPILNTLGTLLVDHPPIREQMTQ